MDRTTNDLDLFGAAPTAFNSSPDELSEHGYAELREAVQGWLVHLRN